MIKLALIGDSHLVAIRRAISRGERSDRFDPTLFAAPRDDIGRLRLQGTVLVPDNPALAAQLRRTSRGQSSIDLTAYDRVVVVGLGFRIQSLLSLLNDFRPTRWAYSNPSTHVISEAVMDTLVDDYLDGTLSVRLSRQIRVSTGRRAIVVPQPLPVSGFADAYRRRWPWLARDEGAAQLMALHATLRQAMHRAAARHGFVLVDQRDDTIGPDGFTLKSYHQVTKQGDLAHLNGDYGVVIMQQLDQLLGMLSVRDDGAADAISDLAPAG